MQQLFRQLVSSKFTPFLILLLGFIVFSSVAISQIFKNRPETSDYSISPTKVAELITPEIAGIETEVSETPTTSPAVSAKPKNTNTPTPTLTQSSGNSINTGDSNSNSSNTTTVIIVTPTAAPTATLTTTPLPTFTPTPDTSVFAVDFTSNCYRKLENGTMMTYGNIKASANKEISNCEWQIGMLSSSFDPGGNVCEKSAGSSGSVLDSYMKVYDDQGGVKEHTIKFMSGSCPVVE